ncbi:hypothetical protein ACVI1L_005621 [Bradyrhizobium sp. USDA 4516]
MSEYGRPWNSRETTEHYRRWFPVFVNHPVFDTVGFKEEAIGLSKHATLSLKKKVLAAAIADKLGISLNYAEKRYVGDKEIAPPREVGLSHRIDRTFERGYSNFCLYIEALMENFDSSSSTLDDLANQFFYRNVAGFDAAKTLAELGYVSVLRDDYMDTHGAHPNSDVNTILWDTTAKKRISIRPFFTETADNGPTLTAMRKAVIAALNAEKKRRDAGETATAEWYKEMKPTLLKIGAVTLAPSTEAGKSSGLTFHYPPYAVGPYAEGQYVIFVPWETLKPYLTPEGAKIFAGARPKGDADEQQ